MNNLQGKTIITTGPAQSSVSLASDLALQGAIVCSMPMIEICTSDITPSLIKTFTELPTYNWILFTSKYGVSAFFELIQQTNSRIPENTLFACVGKKTAYALELQGISADFICSKNNGKDFAAEFSKYLTGANVSVLFPTGNLTQKMIELNVDTNITIHTIIVYKTIPPTQINEIFAERIIKNKYDYLIFTSPSGITNFVQQFRTSMDIRDIRAVSIGPSTTKAIRSYGITNIIQSKEYNFEGIIHAITNL